MRRESTAISPITDIIAAIRGGEIVVLVDDEDRENEGDLVFAADFVTPEKINFLARHGRGLICMPITEEHAQRLGLRPMVQHNRSRHGTNFTVSIEAAEGIATGISAHDRALTVKVAASPSAKAEDIVQPGHVFPLIAQPGGVLVRAGHTEACCDLARLAGLAPAAVLCEIMRDEGEDVPRLHDVFGFRACPSGDSDGQGAVVRRDAGGDAFGGLDGDGEVGAVPRAVLLDHRAQAETLRVLLGDRHADQAAAVLGEEIDLLGGDELGGEDEVALVLAVLVVDEDDGLAGADRGDDLGDRADGSGFSAHGPILIAYCSASAPPVLSLPSPVFSRMRADLPERARR